MSCCDINQGAQKCIRWAIFSLSILAFVFASVASGHCSFLRVGSDDSDDNQDFGLFSFEFIGDYDDDGNSGSCLQYPEGLRDEFGTPLRVARAFGVLTAVSTGFAMIFIVLVQFFLNKCVKPFWLVARILFIVSLISQCLTFTVFGVDECSDADLELECTLGAAGIIASLNTVVIVVLIVLSWLVPAPSKPMLIVKLNKVETDKSPKKKLSEKNSEKHNGLSGNGFQETKKVSVVEGPNGERTITEEVTHADGSKTVTKSVETIDTAEVVEIGSDQPAFPSRSSHGRYGEP